MQTQMIFRLLLGLESKHPFLLLLIVLFLHLQSAPRWLSLAIAPVRRFSAGQGPRLFWSGWVWVDRPAPATSPEQHQLRSPMNSLRELQPQRWHQIARGSQRRTSARDFQAGNWRCNIPSDGVAWGKSDGGSHGGTMGSNVVARLSCACGGAASGGCIAWTWSHILCTGRASLLSVSAGVSSGCWCC